MFAVRLVGLDGTVVVLEPISYQFPSPPRDHWDDNWLIIAGRVDTPDDTWSFRDASLTTFEARSIGPWLRAVAEGTVQPVEDDIDGVMRPHLSFLEPNVALAWQLSRTAASPSFVCTCLTNPHRHGCHLPRRSTPGSSLSPFQSEP